MRIMFNTEVNLEEIKNTVVSYYIYTNIYLDRYKRFSLTEIDTDETDLIHKLGIKRFICISGDWACEIQSGEGSFFHKFKGVKYHRSFNEEAIKNGYLDIYVQDRKLFMHQNRDI